MIGEPCITNSLGEVLSRISIDPPAMCVQCERATMWRFYLQEGMAVVDVGPYCSIRCCLDRQRQRAGRSKRRRR